MRYRSNAFNRLLVLLVLRYRKHTLKKKGCSRTHVDVRKQYCLQLLVLIVLHNNKNGNFYSALPIKNFTAQGAYKSDTNNNNITQTHAHTLTHTHAHTHTHTPSHTSSFMNYMPPKYTCQKAENQTTIGASYALSLSLSCSPYSLTHRCRSHAVLQEEK